jgi:glycosyltransferase involved in cell wall biosynthesis
MKVSVLIPTYNRGYIIRDALESVLSQTYRDFEILVIDDGSSDDTREIVESLGRKEINYLQHERNRGCSAAYNTGIFAATGQLVGFLDSDDLWTSDYLERQVAFFTRHPNVDIVFTDTEIQSQFETIPSLVGLMGAFPSLLRRYPKSEEYVFSDREMYYCLLQEVPIKPSACVVRREMFEKGEAFDEAWPSGTDWDLFLRFARYAHFGYLDRRMVVQRRTADATHQLFREQDHQFLVDVLLKEKAALGDDPAARRAVNRGLAIHYNSLAWTYLERNEGARALSTYLRGFKETRNPLLLRKFTYGLVRIAGRSISGAPVQNQRVASPEHTLRERGSPPTSIR